MTEDRSETHDAYARTSFWVDAPEGRIRIRVGERNETLERLLIEHGASTWAYITAYNPRARTLSAAENEKRQRELEHQVRTAGLISYTGEGKGDSGSWPPEPSLLILGLEQDRALELAQRFAQEAIVFGRRGESAQLLFCPEPVAGG